MQALRRFFTVTIFLVFSLAACATVIIIYVSNDRITIAGDGIKNVQGSTGVDSLSYWKYCKVRFIKKICFAMAGFIEINQEYKYFGVKRHINFDAWKILDTLFNKYPVNISIYKMDSIFKNDLLTIGLLIAKNDVVFKTRSLSERIPTILSISLTGNFSENLKSKIFNYSFELDGTKGNIKQDTTSLSIQNDTGRIYTLGQFIDSIQEANFRKEYKSNKIQAFNKLVNSVSDKKYEEVGGLINIVEINRKSCKWLQRPSCEKCD